MVLMARSREYQGERKLRINVQRVSETGTTAVWLPLANPAQAAFVRTGPRCWLMTVCLPRLLLLQMKAVDYAQEGHRLLQLIQQPAQ